MDKITRSFTKFFSSFQGISMLLMRLVLAYGFYQPAIMKLSHYADIVSWFRDTLHLPFPEVNAFLATSVEALGVIALVLGLKTRFFAAGLMVIMTVAILSVHGLTKFACADNGFEIPLYYFLMLFVLLSYGAGKYSFDETFLKKYFGSGK